MQAGIVVGGPENMAPQVNVGSQGNINMGQGSMGYGNTGQVNIGQQVLMGFGNVSHGNIEGPASMNIVEENMGHNNMGSMIQGNMGQINMGFGNMNHNNMGIGNMGHGDMGHCNMGGNGMNPEEMRRHQKAQEKFQRDAMNFQRQNSRPNNFTSIGNVDTYGHGVHHNPNKSNFTIPVKNPYYSGNSHSRPLAGVCSKCCQVM